MIKTRLLHLISSLKQCNRPRDNTLLDNLLTSLATYCQQFEKDLNLASSGVFDAREWQNVESDVLSFMLQLAGLCSSLCEEGYQDIQEIDNFFKEMTNEDSQDSMIVCGWLRGMKYIVSQHKSRPIAKEILTYIINCLSDKNINVKEDAQALSECLIDNCFSVGSYKILQEDMYNVNCLLNNFKKDLHNISLLNTILGLLEKIYENSKPNGTDIPQLLETISLTEVAQVFNKVIIELPMDKLQIDRILSVTCLISTSVRGSLRGSPVNEFEGILKELLRRDNKIKVIQVASWMMTCSIFKELHADLEQLFLFPLFVAIKDQDVEVHRTQKYQFGNCSFNSGILCHVFRLLSGTSLQLTSHNKVFDSSLKFLQQCHFDSDISLHSTRCYLACLDAISTLVPKISEILIENKLCLPRLLLKFQADQSAVSRLLGIIEKLSCDDKEFIAELFSCLFALIQSEIWDIRNSVVTYIGCFCGSNPTQEKFQHIIEYDLHKLVWRSLDDGEPYVRASSINTLRGIHRSSSKLQIKLDVTQESALEKMVTILTNDKDAVPRKSAVDFIVEHIASNIHDMTDLLARKEFMENVINVMATSASNDLDYEVQVSILKCFQNFLFDILFQQMWIHFLAKTRQLSVEDICENKDIVNGRGNEHINNCLFGFELNVASTILSKLCEAVGDCELSVREFASSFLKLLLQKLLKNGAESAVSCDISGDLLKEFVCCFCNETSMQFIKTDQVLTGNAVEDRQSEALDGVNSLLDNIALCMAPPMPHEEDYWTSDDDGHDDFNIVDCY